MRLNKYERLIFPIIAYSILFFIILIKYLLIKNNADYLILIVPPIVLFIVTISLELKGVIKIIEDMKDNSSIIEECKIIKLLGKNYLLFIIAYLFPFLSFEFNMFSIILALLYILYIYINSSSIVINLLMMFAGYKLYEARYNSDEIMLLSKNNLGLGQNDLKLMEFTENIYLVKEE